jgi:hypothetical protein
METAEAETNTVAQNRQQRAIKTCHRNVSWRNCCKMSDMLSLKKRTLLVLLHVSYHFCYTVHYGRRILFHNKSWTIHTSTDIEHSMREVNGRRRDCWSKFRTFLRGTYNPVICSTSEKMVFHTTLTLLHAFQTYSLGKGKVIPMLN